MSVATLTEKGQVVIPAAIRRRHELHAGTQVEFTDDDGVIRLVVRRRATVSDPASGYGLIKVSRPGSGARRLSDFDPASLAGPKAKR